MTKDVSSSSISSSLLFTQQLNEELYNCYPPNNHHHQADEDIITSYEDQQKQQDVLTQQYHEFFSRMTNKIHSMLENDNSNYQKLIQDLQSMLSQNNNDVGGGYNIQQQIVYLLAMYCIIIREIPMDANDDDSGNNDNNTIGNDYDGVIDFICSFLMKKLEYYRQCKDKSNDDDDDDGHGIMNNIDHILQSSMVIYLIFIDYILLQGNKDHSDSNNNERFIKLLTLRDQMKEQLTNDGSNKDISQVSTEALPLFINDINIPMEVKEQLRTLHEQDKESFQLLEPFLIQLQGQQQGVGSLTPSFIRPLPPLSNYSNRIDIFDYESSHETLDNIVEMKDYDEENNNNKNINTAPSHDDDNNNHIDNSNNYYNYHQQHCKNLLFFLHPTDPFLRFLYMNTSMTYHNKTTKEKDQNIESLSTLHGDSIENKEEISHILTEAFVRSLDAQDEETILELFTKVTTLPSSSECSQLGTSLLFENVLHIILECGFTPENLPKLVKYNHTIAYQCLLILLLASDDNVKNHTTATLKKGYLSSVVGMDISLESMEVVYQLATYSHSLESNKNNNHNKKSPRKPLLNVEYIHMFVSNFISSCENTHDRNRQFKYVRLLSVFLQTLIQKDIVKVEVSWKKYYNIIESSHHVVSHGGNLSHSSIMIIKDLYVEVQQFCIHFSRVEEAASLFKMLKESRTKSSI